MRFGRVRRAEDLARAERQWRALPTEARIAMLVGPAAMFLVLHGLHAVPAVREAVSAEELGAAGTLMALFSFLFIQFTFGRVAKKNLDAQEEALIRARPALDSGLGGIRAGGALVLRHDPSVIARLTRLQAHDPAFSEVLLGRFSRSLLARCAAATDDAGRAALAPYITRAALRDLQQRIGDADQVLAGPTTVVEARESEVWTVLEVEQPFLASTGTAIRRVALKWTLRRTSAARSPVPVDLLAFACPACGAAVETTHPDGQCTSCGTGITHGQLCWQVIEVSGPPDAPMWPEGRPGGGEHPSVLPPTAEDEGLEAALRSLSARHPQTPVPELEKRAARAALAWFEALATGRAELAAPLVSDDLGEALRYEIGRLRAGRLVVHGGSPTVDQVEWARAATDGWNELVDLRIFLTIPWHVVDARGQTVDGDPDRPRELSIYVRLHHPSGPNATLDGWRMWQVIDPREFLR